MADEDNAPPPPPPPPPPEPRLPDPGRGRETRNDPRQPSTPRPPRPGTAGAQGMVRWVAGADALHVAQPVQVAGEADERQLPGRPSASLPTTDARLSPSSSHSRAP
jgi:hypothetical protein